MSLAENQRGELVEAAVIPALSKGGGKPDQGFPAVSLGFENQDTRTSSALDPKPDGRRYAACGDGVVEPVARWIGDRVHAVRERLAAMDQEAAA